MQRTVCIIGASGGIGRAMTKLLIAQPNVHRVFALSRSKYEPDNTNVSTGFIDLEDEGSIQRAAAEIAGANTKLDAIVVATGILHDDDASLRPEKTFRNLNADAMSKVFRVNTIGPSLIAKHFVPLLCEDRRSVFAALSARVGSIGDNRIGGWYSYRASKSALNMILKTLAIEMKRTNPKSIAVGLHPGTVDTGLSSPFQRNVPKGKLFDSEFSARHLLNVMDGLTETDSGKVFDWAGKRIVD